MKSLWYWTNDYYYLARGFWHSLRLKENKFDLNKNSDKKLSVIVVSGLSFRWGFLKSTIDVLENEGFCICPTPQLGMNYMDVKNSAQRIEEIIDNNNLNNVVILGYSKGGVVAKYALLHNNSKNKIKGVIAVACPFSGSRLVRAVPQKSFSELRRKSAIIEELQSDKTSNSRIYSIYPVFDNHVWPQGGSYLDGGHNIEIPVRGHHKILFDRKAHEAIVEVTKEIEKEL